MQTSVDLRGKMSGREGEKNIFKVKIGWLASYVMMLFKDFGTVMKKNNNNNIGESMEAGKKL